MVDRFPVRELASDVEDAFQSGLNRWILTAPTGSGKSTQLPQMLLDSPGFPVDKRIVVLQPRRLAARLLAGWVAQQRGVRLGGEVGYQVRFDARSGEETRIEYVTEGILLRRLLDDPTLSKVGCVILDEFHERHLYTDLTLGRLKALQENSRPDLLLLVMSATLDLSALGNYLPDARVFASKGRVFPVETEFAPPVECDPHTPVWERVQRTVRRRLPSMPEGDVLIFLPGAHEIRRTIRLLMETPECRNCEILALFGELPQNDQDRAVAGSGDRRKIIVSTNIAETSITIEGVRWVIDSGLARIPGFDPHRGLNTLIVQPISKFSAEQRAGRAGRTGPGQCTRLWTEAVDGRRLESTLPEVRRLDLSEAALFLKASGFTRLADFPWLDEPEAARLERAESLLRDLGAVDTRGVLTAVGRQMASFPLHPRFTRMFYFGSEQGCLPELALAAALLQDRSILVHLGQDRHRERARDEAFLDEVTTGSDFLYQMKAWSWARERGYDRGACAEMGIHGQTCRQVERAARQFLAQAERAGLDVRGGNPDAGVVRQGLLLGFADQVGIRRDRGTRRCLLAHGRSGELRRESVVSEPGLLVAAELEEVSRGGQVHVLAGMATRIEPEWLKLHFPEDFREEVSTGWDDTGRRIVSMRRVHFRDLLLESGEEGEVDEDLAARLWSEAVMDGRFAIKGWDGEVERWIERVNFMARWDAESGIGSIGDAERRTLLEMICHGCRSARELRDRDPWPVLRSWLPEGMDRWLDLQAPEELALPTRRRPSRLRYDHPDQPPVLAATIQELYDVTPERLTVLGGKLPLRLELLAPNRRPVQILAADQLADFWTRSYPEIRKELRGRYPKHEWR